MSTSAVGVQKERAPGFLGVDQRQKGCDGGDGRDPVPLRDRPPGRQPADLRGSGEAECLRQAAARAGRIAVAGAHRAAGLRDPAHHRDGAACAPEEAGTAGGLLGKEGDRVLLRLTHHVLERADRAGVCDLPPAASDRRLHITPERRSSTQMCTTTWSRAFRCGGFRSGTSSP